MAWKKRPLLLVPLFILSTLAGPILAVALLLFASALTGQEKQSTGPQNSNSQKPRYETAIGSPLVWDFTKSLPTVGTLRKGSEYKKGLVPNTFDINTASGFQIKTALPFGFDEAFLFESEIIPGTPEGVTKIDNRKTSVIWDNLYITYIVDPNDARCHQGFQLALNEYNDNCWQPILYLGFGRATNKLFGPKIKTIPGKPVRLSFYFDANGSVLWNFDGAKLRCFTADGPLAKGKYMPVIGDRYGSNYNVFNGTIRRIALTPFSRAPIAVRTVGRQAFSRGESNASIETVLTNFSKETLRDIKITVTQKALPYTEQQTGESKNRTALHSDFVFTMNRSELPAGKKWTFQCPIETRIEPGRYPVEMKLTAKNSVGEVLLDYDFQTGIGPLFSDRMPALIWMYNNRPLREVLDFGFTHGLTGFGFSTPEENSGDLQNGMNELDNALTEGFRLVKAVSVAPPNDKPADDYMRLDRKGNILPNQKQPQLEVSNPAVQEYARATAEKNRVTFGAHPGWGGVLPNSEKRDGVVPSFRTEPGQYKQATGQTIPEEVVSNVPPRNLAAKRFPTGIVPDNDPILQYYSWFWNGGDGWPTINSTIAREYRKVSVRPFFSFFDPAVRTPPKWGSGGDVDVLSQWVYAVPEPIAVAGPADELEAMAAGHKQKTMIMTQIICYRAQIAPKDKKVSPEPNWVREKPDADFPTIPPDSLQEATWAMLAKPVQGIMFHGYACIVETGAKKGYTFTNAETSKRMAELLKNLVAPLGPTLKRLPRPERPVAVLESFTSTIFNAHGTWGWIAPDLIFMQRARLDPRVLYEETILRDGFGKTKVLYLPKCDYLTDSIIKKIHEFQKKGGIVIGDELLNSAIKPDLTVPVNEIVRKDVDQGKKKSFADIEQLRKKLDPLFKPEADSSSPELITFCRQWNKTSYLFVINDSRTFGDYVGQWKMTMEKGLPFEGFVTMADPDRKILSVYELSRGGTVPFTRKQDGTVKVDLKYTTNDGRLLLFLDQTIHSLALKVSKTVTRGETCKIRMQILDESKQTINALLPIEIRMLDPDGKELDGGGYACAENGTCRMNIQTNLNGPIGTYKIICKDRASGLTTEQSVSVTDSK